MAQPCGNPGCTNYKADGAACCLACERTLWGTQGKHRARPPVSNPSIDPLPLILAKLDEAIALNTRLTERMDAITKMLEPPVVTVPEDREQLLEALAKMQDPISMVIQECGIVFADGKVTFPLTLRERTWERIDALMREKNMPTFEGTLEQLLQEALDAAE